MKSKNVHDILSPPQKPDDWVEQQPPSVDESKVVHHFTSDGLEYWPSLRYHQVCTSNSDVWLSFHLASYVDYSHFYFIVHFDGVKVTITRESDHMFSHSFQDKAPDGSQIWRIDSILHQLDVPDFDAYPWADMAVFLPIKKLGGLKTFESREQQERFIYLTEMLLSCISGNWLPLRYGTVQKGVVVWGEDLQTKFKEGALIS
ncbi:hypothetical protein DS901_04050 [Loktanella sp. D2R18]|uniref:hypothetical protein n=1 Tax=Rhodobacterales TaxID=204455 RepID=UPI000DEBBF7B|nr:MULTISPECIES: hypothetical protein [Rhodobacterales]MDO6589170.1 hypothetical protein [Yoonia sp. 1_MG-2023]RBW45402.1 hypothetical protein DS901_04050 [Loktanella sp. D2R18]